MKRNLITLGLTGLVLAGGVFAYANAQPAKPAAPAQPNVQPPVKEADDETPIKLTEAPEGVRAAILKLTPEKALKRVTKEDEDGVMLFEAEYEAEGIACSAKLTERGEVLEIEKAVKADKLPAAVTKALNKEYPGATIKSAESIQVFYFEVAVTSGGKTHPVKVYASGIIDDDEHEERAKDGKGEKDDDDDNNKKKK